MRTMRYGFFGEDRGQRAFLAAYLLQRSAESEVAFEAVDYFGKRFGPMNNKVVDRRCGDACRDAFFLEYPLLDCLFIGRDVDSFDPRYLERRTADLLTKVPAQWQGRTLLLLPVQCIEHWLLYLAQYPDRKPVELKPNDQTKKLVYANKTRSHEAIITELLLTLVPQRISWLAEVSDSFRVFHLRVNQYLDALV